jgi:hypothetical protein
MDWNYVISFSLGALGALVIVWFRWIDALPRFKTAIEIANLEDEYDVVSDDIVKKIKDKLPVDPSEVTHSENLRDDIWRQRCNSFFVSAFMYIVLGGATALIFIGLDIANPLDSAAIIKLISAGALWSTFYSFIDMRNTEKFSLSKMKDINDGAIAKITEKQQGQIKEYQDKINESYQDCQALRDKYHAVINEYEEKIQQSNQNIRTVIEKYNLLVDEYQKLSGRSDAA